MTAGFKTPVAMFNFNRPHMTRQVFEVVRQIKPARLLLVADGPRTDRPDDARLCAEVRAIFNEIDWECEVSRNFADTNMGSFKRNSSGLNWVFDTVEESIILEDDCIPSLSFFPYCEELLERYRKDDRVSTICGFSNLNRCDSKHSYFFSRYQMTWGWATWRRTWNLVDLNMRGWPNFKSVGLPGMLPESWIRNEWLKIYDAIYYGKMNNGWDYQLQLTGWMNNMLAVVPNVSLIQNIGYGLDATHTHSENSANADVVISKMEFPLLHPEILFRDVYADRYIEKTHFGRTEPTMFRLIGQKIRSMLRKIIGFVAPNG